LNRFGRFSIRSGGFESNVFVCLDVKLVGLSVDSIWVRAWGVEFWG